MTSPLDGLRVVDLTRYLAGPFCAMLLGDMGADVIKIEPLEGDDIRKFSFSQSPEPYAFLTTNRNKRSLAMDLRTPEGKEILLRLISSADVLVENFRPGVMARMGLDYPRLKPLNPRLIYCGISAFGQTGPYASRPGFDQIGQGLSGLMSVTGDAQSAPMRVGIAIGDLLAGIFGAYGVLAALAARHKTGQGQQVNNSILSSLVGVMSWSAGYYFETGEDPPPAGNDHPISYPYGVFEAADGRIIIATANQKMWEDLCRLLDLPELIEDARFRLVKDRLARRDELRELLNVRLRTRPSTHWVELLNSRGIACGPILTLSQVFDDPQVLSQGMLLEMDHPTQGRIRNPGFPVHLEATPCSVRYPPPVLGQHTRQVLKEAGFTEEQASQWEKAGIIYQNPAS